MSRNQTKCRYLFEKFLNELEKWAETGKEPECGDQDIRYYLDLQEQRLKEHDLKETIHFQPEEEICSSHEISSALPFSEELGLSRFNRSTCFQQVEKTLEFHRNGDRVYRKKSNSIVYEIITEADPEDETIGNTSYTCSNCGAISLVKVLKETGCPYCGTKFMTDELYPKVTNFYTLMSPVLTKKEDKYIKPAICILAVVISLIQTLLSAGGEDFHPVIGVLGFLAGIVIWGFFLYFISAIVLLCRVIHLGIRSFSVCTGSAGSKRRLTNKLRKYDPEFDYEYFEGKALSLARTIMLSKNPESFPQYRGPETGERFKDIIDIRYRGGLGVNYIKNEEDKLKISLKLFLTNTIDNGKKVKDKDEIITMEMFHYSRFPVDKGFSITKVCCPHCGGSFDGRKEKNCIFCGTEYDSGINDWVVTDIRR